MNYVKVPPVKLPDKCWEQLPNESAMAYKHFSTFLNLGPTRKMKDFCTHGRLKELAAKHYWLYRVTQYEIWLNMRALSVKEKEFVASKSEWNNTLDTLRRKVQAYADTPDKSVEDGLNKVMLILTKEAKVAEFLIGSHKAIFGEKHTVDATVGPPRTLNLEEL